MATPGAGSFVTLLSAGAQLPGSAIRIESSLLLEGGEETERREEEERRELGPESLPKGSGRPPTETRQHSDGTCLPHGQQN